MALGAARGERIDAGDLAGLIAQFQDEGYAEPLDSGWLLRWDSVYALLTDREYGPALEVFAQRVLIPSSSGLRLRGKRSGLQGAQKS